MTIYPGKKGNLKGTSLVVLTIIAIILSIFFFTKRGVFAWFIMICLAFLIPLVYKGMILKITLYDNRIVILRPISRQTIKIADIAFCAVHDIGEGNFTLYSFMKNKKNGDVKITGIKSDKSYDEVLKTMKKGGKLEGIQINFNKADKIPIALVENSDELKEKILDNVDIQHYDATYC
ncbi:MAG: hypothetical protein GX154_11130 [Clostridiales bacterium]|nr:hypothetical protein [Clostridiales bacterium]